MEASQGLAEVETLNPRLAESYLRYVQEAKEAAKNGDLQESLKLFNLAKDIFPTKKVISRIQKLQEALEQLAEEDGDDEFTDVCNSGLVLYRELYEKLFEHQKEGIAFLYSLYKDQRKGGILADDMGLGKTVQIIAFLSGMFDASLVNHVLLIMPTSLINTWVKEFAKWTPGMRVKTFHGSSKDERTKNLTRIQQRSGVIITTYQMLINNWKQLASFNDQTFVWDYVILDEAHKIKSASTKSAICARAVPASNRLLLTGTPIQNNLQELWSLFDFACQGSLLGTLKTFKMEYENPIIRAREKDATPGEKALGLKISENLMEIIKPYFLRRTKEEVQTKKADKPEGRLSEKNPGVEGICEMPSFTRKNDFIVWIRLVPLQEEIYRKFVSLDHIKELLMETRSPLAELGVLKKLCDHPRLLSARACHLLNLGTATLSAQDENEQGDTSDVNSLDHLTDRVLMEESGKMIFLMALLERLQDEGHQTVVFSQSRQILNIIERLLKNKHFKMLRIDGTITHLWEREKRIQLFQQSKEYSVFLLTTQVGGVGLTLTAATRVVIFDPSWNPATDAQAVDRVYRIGQKENVVVYRLITCGTVEEKIYRRQIFKDSLIRQSTGDKKNPFRYFSKQELRELFTVGDLQNSATQLQLQSLHAAQRRSDEKLDEHIAYLHSLNIAGISDHDLMFTHELSVKEELAMLEESPYIQQRVQKAQLLVEFESQNTMERQKTGNEETWLKAHAFSSQRKKKGPELNKPWPQPSHLLTNPTQVEAISSQMASISIGDQSSESESQDESQDPSKSLDITLLQGDGHHYESTLDADTGATSPQEAGSMGGIWTDSTLGPAECFAAGNEAMQKKASQASPGQEALPENLLGSFNYLPRQSMKADLGSNLDLQDSSPTADENQNIESDVHVIEISDVLSASPSALQGAQASEAQLELEEDLSESPPEYACDFNLLLEDSADNRQNLSKVLGLVEKENSSQSPAANTRAESAVNRSFDSSNESDDEPDMIIVKTRSKARRILSDTEDEDAFKGTSSTSSFSTSPYQFSSVKQFDASSPKNDKSPPGRFFSPRIPDSSVNISLDSRRSLASRRSLINVVLDDVEDMEERLESSSEEESAPGHEEEEEEESSEEASVHTEEDPSEEAQASGNKPSSLTESEPRPLTPKSSPCSPEPLSSDPLVEPPQEPAVEAADDYETLVARGRELKECGKIQEALNCLVKALDIKSADPEVMLMTLSLYKQLNA